MITATPSIIGDLAVETDGLVKTFGATRAVDGVNLAIPRGSVYGVLGPNGAGKKSHVRRPDLGGTVIRDKLTGPAGNSVIVADPGGALLALFTPAAG